MAEAGGSVFANMPLIFAIGVALGFTNNDGVSALVAVVACGIMVKTMAVVAPLVLHLPAEEIASKHRRILAYWGLSPVRSQRTCLTVSTVLPPEYLGLPVNALCRSFQARLPSLLALCCPSFAADWFCNPDLLSVGCLPEPGSCVWHLRFHRTLPGTVWFAPHLERTLQMQIANTPTQQVRFSTATFRVIWRLRVNCLVASCSKCTVCQLPQLLSGTLLNQKTARKWRYYDLAALTRS